MTQSVKIAKVEWDNFHQLAGLTTTDGAEFSFQAYGWDILDNPTEWLFIKEAFEQACLKTGFKETYRKKFSVN
jgi:YD repeat-containing protein